MRQATILVVSSILTAIAAFAKPTRSAIAAKGEPGRGGTPTYSAKDYVQDGLIALWDGIENVGWGMHDAQTTVWKDLSGNENDLTLMNGAHFDANSLVTAARNSVSALLSTTLPYATIEVCAFFDASRNSSALVCFGNSVNNSRMMSCSPNKIQGLNGNAVITVSTSEAARTWAATYPSSSSAIQYIDGQLATGSVGNNSWSNRTGNFGLSGSSNYASYNFVGNYYSVRLYSRPLTAEEIVHNYAVDKARFNLP